MMLADIAGLQGLSPYLSGVPLLGALVLLGLCVGLITGLFGIGGAFLVPMLYVVLGIDYQMAIGSSLSFTVGTGAGGWMRHARLGNLAPRTMAILAACAICGTNVGAGLNGYAKAGLGAANFDVLMSSLFVVLLVSVAALVWSGASRERKGPSLLQRLPIPPRITIRSANLVGISLPGLCAIGLFSGMLTGMMGIGGGVIFMPLLLLVVGLSMHQAVGTSLGVVLCGSIAGVVVYGSKGQSSLWIVMPLLISSSIGVQVGAWVCQKLHASRLRRMFSGVVLLVAVMVAIKLASQLRAL